MIRHFHLEEWCVHVCIGEENIQWDDAKEDTRSFSQSDEGVWRVEDNQEVIWLSDVDDLCVSVCPDRWTLQSLDSCVSPTTALQRSKRPVTHLSDLRHSWAQCAPKMVKALSTASADDARNSSGVMFDCVRAI